MLRVGLTGGLGSGKSTAARLFAALGAHVLSSDAIGRQLMQPGEPVYDAIRQHFGPAIVLPGGQLDRPALARIAFSDGRAEELNALVHPAVIEREAQLAQQIFRHHPEAVVLVESALIFETLHGKASTGADHPQGQSWRQRFDRMILVSAPDEPKIQRFVERCSAGQPLDPARRQELEGEAIRRMARQIPDEQKAALCDYVLVNGGALKELEWQVDQLWPILRAASLATASGA